MMFFKKIGVAWLLAAGAAFSQTASQPAFEVASVKAAAPITAENAATEKLRIGMKVDAAMVNIRSMSLADLIRTAYRVKSYQVSGPDSILQQRYNVVAKIPDGASSDQVPEMLQSLLAERFKLTLHREQREHAVYALVVGKNGPKLKEATPDAAAPGGEAPRGDRGGTSSGQIRTNGSGEGKATAFNSGPGAAKMSPDSAIHIERKMTLDSFAEFISRFADRPVVDMTELKGTYELAIDVSLANLMRARGAVITASGGSTDPGAADRTAESSSGPSIFTGVQKLGLKLEPRKGPIQVLVVDKAEKTPTEN